MSNFIELALSRQSARKYQDKKVSRDLLNRCVEAVRIAPSATNEQPWKFVVVDEPEMVKKVAGTTYNSAVRFNKFVENAPAIAVITMSEAKGFARVGRALKKKDWPLIDIGIAATHFCLQAEELGLATCMIGWFGEKSIKKILQIPAKENVALLITVGYAPEGYKQRKKIRKELDAIVSYNQY